MLLYSGTDPAQWGALQELGVEVLNVKKSLEPSPDSEVKNRARARSVGIVRRNKARIFSHHFVALA